MKARHLLEATGASILVLFPYFSKLVSPSSMLIYHHVRPLTTMVRGLLLDMLGVFVLGYAVIIVVSRFSPRARRVVGALLAGMVIWRFMGLTMGFAIALISSGSFGFAQVVSRYWGLSAIPLKFVVPLLLAVFAWWIPAISRQIVRGVRLGLAGFAFSSLWIAPPLFSLAFVTHSVTARESVSAQPRERQDRRVVWILLDELSNDLAFEHRPVGLPLPQLEKLHSTSVSFGNLEPTGYFTDHVIPSVLLGQRIDQIRSDLDGNLWYMDQAQHKWVSYDAGKTLFGLANANGWNPSVSGWFNPYCRIFGSLLTSCFWKQDVTSDLPLELKGASNSKSSIENALVFPRNFLSSRFSGHALDDKTLTYNRVVRDYHSLMTEASTLIQNDRVHFVFVHLPLPHPPGYYDRKTHRFSKDGNYLDNLVLADDTLGELMQEIGRTPSADRTTVIISSDHSWRVHLWKEMAGWTKEEEQISQGHFEPHPVFLVHFPGQKSGHEVLTPLPEMVEHDIIESMLKGGMKNPEDLSAFLQSSTQQVAHTH